MKHGDRKIFSFKYKNYRLRRIIPYFLLAVAPVFHSCEMFDSEYVATIEYDPVDMPGIDMNLVYKYLSEGYYDKVVIVMLPNDSSRYFNADKWHAVTNNVLDVYNIGNGVRRVGSRGEIIVAKKIPEDSRDSIGIRYEDSRLLEYHYITITERGK